MMTFENIFQNIAAVFENSADDVTQWQAPPLSSPMGGKKGGERMRLNVTPLRPAAIDDAAYDALDELRRFRHLFRHAYSVKFDPARLQLVMHKALALKAMYADQLERFIDFLHSLT